ncbi:ZIP-like iron-zinc transporter [Marasmius fiardii PR-910]|nr:ZIP-like iron-zinc transporter [Marasmius fiardii PR-910]
MSSEECDALIQDHKLMGLRIASIFIIGAGATLGALFPVLAKGSKFLKVPQALFDFAKYFGSGVIIATAFIHLLAPALEAFDSPCLAEGWSDYPYALALCMLSIFSLFVIEVIAFRWGTAKLAKLGARYDTHGHEAGGSHAAHGPEDNDNLSSNISIGEPHPVSDIEKSLSASSPHKPHSVIDNPLSQIIGVAILEFGVVLHSVLIGLTLAVDEEFKILFIVLVFHQTFEGLGIGSRLAYLKLPPSYNYVPIFAAILYGLTTPIGIAVGLGIRDTFNSESATTKIVSGTLDSLSAGILIYTGLVELLAHEFLFNKEMMSASNGKLAYSLGCMVLGWGLMSLLGRWA